MMSPTSVAASSGDKREDKPVNPRMTRAEEYVGDNALINYEAAQAEFAVRDRLAKEAGEDRLKAREDIKRYEDKIRKYNQYIVEAKEDEDKLSGEMETHQILRDKAAAIMNKYKEDKRFADKRAYKKSPRRGRDRDESSSGSEDKRPRRSKTPNKRPATPPRLRGTEDNFREDTGRQGRPMIMTDLERRKYADSRCNKCGDIGHHARFCVVKDARCFNCGGIGHRAGSCPNRGRGSTKGGDKGSGRQPSRRPAGDKFDFNSLEPHQVAEGKAKGFKYFHEDKVEANTTVVIKGIPPDANEETWLPNMLKGGGLNCGWENPRIIAVNVMRDHCPTTDRRLVNRGEAFLKFRVHADAVAWVKEFDGLILTIRGGEAKISAALAKRDIVSYREDKTGPMAIRVYKRVWAILDPRDEE